MTKIRESAYSAGGPCHCGKVGLYAVPRHGHGPSHIDFFCADHRDEATDLMRKVHGLSSMRAERRFDAAMDHIESEEMVYNPEGKHQSQPGQDRARRRY